MFVMFGLFECQVRPVIVDMGAVGSWKSQSNSIRTEGSNYGLVFLSDLRGHPHIEPYAVVFDLVNGRRVLLGSGGSSVVYKGTYNGQPVAIKVFRNMRPEDINDFIEEALLHHDFTNQPFVCKLFGGWTVIDPDNDIFPSMILEYLPLSLSSVAHNAEKFSITMDNVRTIFIEIARTLSIKSESGQTFSHNDLNPSNIMLTENFKPRLIDFGLARWNDGPQSAVAEGTVTYMVGLHWFNCC